MTKKTNGLPPAEFARQNGWTRQYVNKLIKSGKIVTTNGLINPAQALKRLEQIADPAAALRKPPPLTDEKKAVDFVSARTMREAYRAQMAKIDFEERSGKLTDAAKVKDDAFRAGRIVRDALLAIPDRLSDILAAEDDPRVIRQLLLDDFEQILNDLSRL